MSTISIIAAIADNNAIGKNQQLLWSLPYDMKRFKGLTTGHAVVMGRKTFESLPNFPTGRMLFLLRCPRHCL